MNRYAIDLDAIRRSRRMTWQRFAYLVGVNQSTLWRWSKEGVPDGPALRLLQQLQKTQETTQ